MELLEFTVRALTRLLRTHALNTIKILIEGEPLNGGVRTLLAGSEPLFIDGPDKAQTLPHSCPRGCLANGRKLSYEQFTAYRKRFVNPNMALLVGTFFRSMHVRQKYDGSIAI